ncbi:HIT family protein [Nocardia tengchongensis]|uniref:HIT family protein n=1 Tax=Nocardia tengchongensis TaxID=2055889 RepID=UPI00368BEC38
MIDSLMALNITRHVAGQRVSSACESVSVNRLIDAVASSPLDDSPPDIVLRTDRATAFSTAGWWPNDHGHVLVIPNTHYENIFDLPPEFGHAVHDVVRQVVLAMRAVYGCDGVSARQRNEPAGGQDFWHHTHVLPRHHGDDPYRSHLMAGYATAEQRSVYTDRLR